jgi:hypothetical protein
MKAQPQMTDAPNAAADGLADFWSQAARTNQSLAECKAIIAEIAAQTAVAEAKMEIVTGYIERKRADYARRMSAPSGPAPAAPATKPQQPTTSAQPAEGEQKETS